jgi:hypothetical protein
MKKEFLKFLEGKNISEDDYKEKSNEEKAQLHSEFFNEQFKAIKESLEKRPTAEKLKEAETSIKNLEDGLKDYAKAEELTKMQKQLKEAQESIDQLKENGGIGGSGDSIFKQIKNFIEKNHDKIKSLYETKSGVIEITVKAPEDITTGNATNPEGIPELVGTQVAPPSNANLRGADILALTTNVNTSLASYPYTETLPKDGDFTFLGEGEAASKIDFTIETRYASPKKIAAYMKLTEESIQDIAGINSIARDLLFKKHNLKKQKGILFGDGLGVNPKGATKYGRTFVAGTMANKVANPNIMDVINACITDIYNTHNYEDEMSYMPSLTVLNPTDFFLQFVSAKDGDGKPLYPTASLFNRVNIGGTTIIPERDVPAGKLFVCDMSRYNTTNYKSYTVQIGWINEDFIKGQFGILGSSRFHAFVKRLDRQAFIYDDIETVKTAIKTV